jgi:hypothetical protein
MGGLAFIILFVLAYIWNSQQPEKSEGDTTAGNTVGIVTAIVIAAILTSFSTTSHLAISISFHLIALCLIFPVIPTRIAVLFGRTKLAYYFGSFSLIRFSKNTYSANLYYGFLAAMKNANDEKRHEHLEWLNEKFLKRSQSLYSGEIIMFTIIDANLTAAHKLPDKLKLLRGLPRASIPKPISKLAYKYALAFELPNNNIGNIVDISNQWGTGTTNHLAKFMLKACDAITNPFAKRGWRLKLLKLRARVPNEIYLWLSRIESQHKNSSKLNDLTHSQKVQELIRFGINNNSSDYSQTKELLKHLASPESKSNWSVRAHELGVWQIEELWEKINNRLLSFEPSNNQSGLIADEQRYLELENHHKALGYLERSILTRVEPKISGASSQHLIDWLKVLDIMSELAVDSASELTAFSSIHNTLWNWLAALWNDKEERRLAIHIATWCIPRAKKCGYDDFLETLHFVTGNAYVNPE